MSHCALACPRIRPWVENGPAASRTARARTSSNRSRSTTSVSNSATADQTRTGSALPTPGGGQRHALGEREPGEPLEGKGLGPDPHHAVPAYDLGLAHLVQSRGEPASPIGNTPAHTAHEHRRRPRADSPPAFAHRFPTPLAERGAKTPRASLTEPRAPPSFRRASARSRRFNTPTEAARCQPPTHQTGSNQTLCYFAGHPVRWVISPILYHREAATVPWQETLEWFDEHLMS